MRYNKICKKISIKSLKNNSDTIELKEIKSKVGAMMSDKSLMARKSC